MQNTRSGDRQSLHELTPFSRLKLSIISSQQHHLPVNTMLYFRRLKDLLDLTLINVKGFEKWECLTSPQGSEFTFLKPLYNHLHFTRASQNMDQRKPWQPRMMKRWKPFWLANQLYGQFEWLAWVTVSRELCHTWMRTGPHWNIGH